MTDRGSNGAAKGDASRERAKHEPARERAKPPASSSALSRNVPADIRDITFHTSVRGYDRREVDRYVQRVNQVIAELEIARSPEAAVRHALERVGEQTAGILQQARETADSIINTARAEAEEAIERATVERREIVERARTEAAGIVADAGREAHARAEQGERELAAARERAEQAHIEADAALAQSRSHADEIVRKAQLDADAVSAERRRVIEQVRELAARLQAVVDAGPGPRAGEEETARHALGPAATRRRSPRREEPATGASRS